MKPLITTSVTPERLNTCPDGFRSIGWTLRPAASSLAPLITMGWPGVPEWVSFTSPVRLRSGATCTVWPGCAASAAAWMVQYGCACVPVPLLLQLAEGVLSTYRTPLCAAFAMPPGRPTTAEAVAAARPTA